MPVDDVVADVALARADPHDVGVRGRQSDGADRGGGLVLEDRLPGVAAVHGLEYATGGRADVVHAGLTGDADRGGHATARD